MVERYRLKTEVKYSNRGGPVYGNPNHKRGNPNHDFHGSPKEGRTIRRLTHASILKAQRVGELPHEFMFRVMHMKPGQMLGDHTLEWDDIKWAAEHAAPYYGAKLSSIKLTGPDDGPLQVLNLDPSMLTNCSPSELEVLAKLFGKLQQKPEQQQDDKLIEADASMYEALVDG